MSNDALVIKPGIQKIDGSFHMGVTTTVFKKMKDAGLDPLNVFSKITSTKKMVVYVRKGKKDQSSYSNKDYVLFTEYGNFTIMPSKDDANSRTIVNFRKNSMLDQNNALKSGITFVFDNLSISMSIREYNIYRMFVNGAGENLESEKEKAIKSYSVRSINAMENILRSVEPSFDDDEDEVQEVYKPERNLGRLLDKAEQYSILSNELEKEKALSAGDVAYYNLEAAEHDRQDRIAYRFSVSIPDESTFKKGVRVEVYDKNDETHTAEIIKVIKEDPEDEDSPIMALDMLFAEQIDRKLLNSAGRFGLSNSIVNMVVQLGAINRIRNNEASAKFMDNVLGTYTPKPIKSMDFSELESKLNAKKYPPNPSQMAAIENGIASQDIYLVMGPPGTGKTTVILEWAKYFVNVMHYRVLISSQNNMAVDNVLERLAEEPDMEIIRVGSEAKVMSSVHPYLFENKVAAFRDKISTDTSNTIDSIGKLDQKWENVSIQLEYIRQQYVNAGRFEKALKETIEREYKPFYDAAETNKQQMAQATASFNSAINEAEKLKEKINKYNSSNKVMKFLFKWSNKKNQEKLRGLIDVIKNSQTQYMQNAAAYESNYQAISQVYEKIKQNEFETYYSIVLGLKGMSRYLLTMLSYDSGVDNIWNLYDSMIPSAESEVNSTGLISVKSVLAFNDFIKKEKERGAKICDAVKIWKEESDGQQNYALIPMILQSVDIVGATCIGINSQKRFASLDFDVAIIDEAGQIQVHNALVPMSVARKAIMLGDHKQIPPVADKELVELCEHNGVKADLLNKSLFEFMYFNLPDSHKTMLDTQFRMPSEIADTISTWFYEGKYKSAGFKMNLKSLMPSVFSSPYAVIDTSGERDRYETKKEGSGCYNLLEAKIIADLIMYVLAHPELEISFANIGVISAYKLQVRTIKNEILRRPGMAKHRAEINEMVASLDSYQGQERKLIIYSFTKSSYKAPEKQGRIGFLSELRRLNVAMTRCKEMLIMIGDMNFLGSCMFESPEEAADPNAASEKRFSEFIRLMMSDVKSGKGECIDVRELYKRLPG